MKETIVKAVFKDAVSNTDGIPEKMFNAASEAPSRRVEMVATEQGIVCSHKGKLFFTPWSNVIYCNFK